MSRACEPLRIEIPGWIDELAEARRGQLQDPEERMQLAIDLARANVERGGGPFGAVVCAGDQLIAAGVNLVLSSGFSIAHAEIVALMRAQQELARLPSYPRPYTLYTSAEPCCQCFGALVWSGVNELVCAATTYDVEQIGFNEGPKPDAWQARLEASGFCVQQEVRRPAAVAVLEAYKQQGGPIYGLPTPTQKTR